MLEMSHMVADLSLTNKDEAGRCLLAVKLTLQETALIMEIHIPYLIRLYVNEIRLLKTPYFFK